MTDENQCTRKHYSFSVLISIHLLPMHSLVLLQIIEKDPLEVHMLGRFLDLLQSSL